MMTGFRGTFSTSGWKPLKGRESMARGMNGIRSSRGALQGVSKMKLPDRSVLCVNTEGEELFSFKSWTPPETPDFASPTDLAHLIIEFAEWANKQKDVEIVGKNDALS